MVGLGYLPNGLMSWANGINGSGQVVGWSELNTGGYTHAFLYGVFSPGGQPQMVDLGTLPGGTTSQASGINNSGQVVGFSNITSGAYHAFLYSGGTMIDLNSSVSADLPSGVYLTGAAGINDLDGLQPTEATATAIS